MIALLEWAPPERGRRRKAVTVKEDNVLHLRLYRASLQRGPRTPEAVLRRRVQCDSRLVEAEGQPGGRPLFPTAQSRRGYVGAAAGLPAGETRLPGV